MALVVLEVENLERAQTAQMDELGQKHDDLEQSEHFHLAQALVLTLKHEDKMDDAQKSVLDEWVEARCLKVK